MCIRDSAYRAAGCDAALVFPRSFRAVLPGRAAHAGSIEDARKAMAKALASDDPAVRKTAFLAMMDFDGKDAFEDVAARRASRAAHRASRAAPRASRAARRASRIAHRALRTPAGDASPGGSASTVAPRPEPAVRPRPVQSSGFSRSADRACWSRSASGSRMNRASRAYSRAARDDGKARVTGS